MHPLGTGDNGYTDLLGAERVPKYEERVEAVGSIDEATSSLGLARALTQSQRVRQLLADLQQDLYLIMAELATPASQRPQLVARVGAADVERIEGETRAVEAEIEMPKQFVLPGALPSSAALDLARTVVRRAERRVAKLVHEHVVDSGDVLRYLNRASSLLYALARYEETSQGVPYSLTQRRRR
ncbi:MAG: cob(I)yrinic acid a,c-diamide adenosyltransferase [Chloroflexi bacterium]|nr:cob(I)yrinic acid a,c-diamide adenosyltransferase [Chloroflexota bacterium]